MSDIATRIRELRQQHGLTLEQVALSVGVGKSTVRKWETGMIANMRHDKIAALAAALLTTPEYLMGWENQDTIANWGQLIKKRRQALGMSAEDLSEATGLAPATIYRYENGTTANPPLSAIRKIESVLNFDLLALMKQSEQPRHCVATSPSDVQDAALAFSQMIQIITQTYWELSDDKREQFRERIIKAAFSA